MCSVWTLVFMSFDRFLAVVYPFVAVRVRQMRNSIILCVALWCASLVFYMPAIYLHNLEEYEHGDQQRRLCYMTAEIHCDESRTLILTFYMTFAVFMFALPLFITSILYSIMISRLWQNPFRKSNEGKQLLRRQKCSSDTMRAKRRITIIVLSVTVIYALCWAPQTWRMGAKGLAYQQNETPDPDAMCDAPNVTDNDNTTMTAQSSTERNTMLWRVFWDVVFGYLSMFCAYVNSCLNPLLYALLMENFRKGPPVPPPTVQ